MHNRPSMGVFAVALFSLGCANNVAPRMAPTPIDSATAQKLTVLTYNVLGDATNLQERLPALLEVLRFSRAEIIALQEVDDWLLNAIADAAWFKAEYHGTRTNGFLDAPAGKCILSRFPIKSWTWHDLPGIQGRTVVIARIMLNGRLLTVATAHLESRLEDGPIRAQQLDAIFQLLSNCEDAVFLGDFNFADGWQPETAHIDKRFRDVWISLRPSQPGNTWDIERNPLAKAGSLPNEKSGRIDRILMRSQQWNSRTIELAGTTRIQTSTAARFPSDHFGVLATFDRSPREMGFDAR